ncbi:MAG: hypothetical protein IKT27_04315, partial [Clostridia bacterium]|nr:hypothetical protein [Clostridia bacterium]
MTAPKKYSFVEGGKIENAIAGTHTADPLGVLMVLAPNLWQDYSIVADTYAAEELLTASDTYYKADSKITDANIKVRSLKRIRVWMDAVIVAFEWFEENIPDPSSRGLAKNQVLGDASHPL